MKRPINISFLVLSSCFCLFTLLSATGTPENSSMRTGAGQLPDTSGKGQISVRPFDLKIIPPSSGVRYYRNGIIFLSYSKNEAKMPSKHISFGSLMAYQGAITDSTIVDYSGFATSIDFRFPCEALTFSKDFNTMYFTKLSSGNKKEKIYKAIYTSGGNKERGWISDTVPLNFCTDNSIFTHPALSSDGKTMIFCSDKSGSAGGMDLFVTRKEGEKWTNPENLGNLINSKGNELYPSFDGDDNLYFSSDGLPGNGGYDIFLSKFNGKSWGKPHNLTSAVNTKDDDIAFIIDWKDGKSAFFTTSDRSGKRKQLYLATLNKGKAGKDINDLPGLLLSMTGQKTAVQEVKPAPSTPVASVTTQKPSSGDAAKKESASKPAQTKQEVKPAETKPQTTTTAVVQKPAQTTEQAQTPPPAETPMDVIIYRVQIISNPKPAGSQKVTIAGKSYNTYEYLYLGAYRSCVGEFSKFSDAVRFQGICRQSGLSQSFVVVFKNDVRSTDPALFK